MNITDIGLHQFQNISRQRNEANLKTTDQKALEEACLDFEALFIKQMLDSMRKTVPESGMMDGGMAEDVFEDMLYDEYSKLMARTSDLGIAEMMQQQLTKKYTSLSGIV
jgi:flagellar protein FlgJ